MKCGSVAPAVRSFAHGTRTNICWHMRKNTIIQWVCHFQISHSGASSATPIWMSTPFRNYIHCTGPLTSQSSAIRPVFPVPPVLVEPLEPVDPVDRELPVLQDEIHGEKMVLSFAVQCCRAGVAARVAARVAAFADICCNVRWLSDEMLLLIEQCARCINKSPVVPGSDLAPNEWHR